MCFIIWRSYPGVGESSYEEEFSRYTVVLPAAMELRWDSTAAWEFLWICSISVKHLFESHIWGAASVSLTQDFVSPKKHILLYDFCLIFGYEGIAIMITTDVIPLAIFDTTVLRCLRFFGWKLVEHCEETRNYYFQLTLFYLS